MIAIQQENLFEDLTPEASSTLEGGASTSGSVNFRNFVDSKSFSVSQGSKVDLSARILSPNKKFGAILSRIGGGSVPRKDASTNRRVKISWTGLNKGTYKIRFVSLPALKFLRNIGPYTIFHS